MDPSNALDPSLQVPGAMQQPASNGIHPAQQPVPGGGSELSDMAAAAGMQPLGASPIVQPGAAVAAVPTQSSLDQQQPQQQQQAVAVDRTVTPLVEIKLFVGRVPRTYDEDALRPIFAEHARVLEVAIIKDKATGAHKGSAFVRLASITEADQAIRALNNIKVLDPGLGPLHVRYAEGEAEKLGLSPETLPGQDQAKLFVGSLPKGVHEDEVHKVFSQFGRIDEVFLMKDPATGACKGCGFVKIAFKEQALNAIKNLNRNFQFPGAPRPLEVRFAESKKSQQQQQQRQGANMGLAGGMGGGAGGANMTMPPSNSNPRTAGPWKEYFSNDQRPYYHNEITLMTQWDRPPEFDQLFSSASPTQSRDVTGPPGANIFVFHIPNDWTEAELHKNFGGFGNIVSAHIATDKTTGRNKGYAFVSFDNVNSAVAAVSCMTGFLANGKRLKVSIKLHEDKYVAHLLPPSGSMGQGPQIAPMAAMAGMVGMTGMTPITGVSGMPQMTHPGNMQPGSPTPLPPVASLAAAAAASSIPQLQTSGVAPGGYAGYTQYGVTPTTAIPQAHHRFGPY